MIGIFGSPYGIPWFVRGRDPLPLDFGAHNSIAVIGIPQANATCSFRHIGCGPFYQSPFVVSGCNSPEEVMQ